MDGSAIFRFFDYICNVKRLKNTLKGLFGLLCCLAAWTEVRAQLPDDEYYPYAVPERPLPMLQPDSALFYRAVQSVGDRYGELTAFGLPQVTVRRRGQTAGADRTVLSGLSFSYRYDAALRMLGAEEESLTAGMSSPEWPVGAGGLRIFRFTDAEPLMPYRASLRLTDRSYTVGARVAAERKTAGGWFIAAAADVRTGRDMHVEGVFTDALTVAVRLARRFDRGGEVALLALCPWSVRGTRLSSTEEAFTLTGDRLYNPAWGFQNGRVRNSRVRREAVPLAAATWRQPLSSATTLLATCSAEAGRQRYSALGWYDARTPMPDNYRCMPSHTGDRETEQAWRAGDARYTQIRWDELIAQNRMAGGEAVHALEERVERVGDVQCRIAFETEIDTRLRIRCGAFFRRSDRRFYKQLRDLLGARYLTDIDFFLVDDDTYGSLLQNDLRHPDRRIGAGDRFAYDYALVERSVGARLSAEYRSDRFRADLAAELSDETARRCGYYEKELFPGEGSFGRSRQLRFTPYALKATVGWSFSPRHYLGLCVTVAARPPAARDLFYQPLYNNLTVDDCRVERLRAVEATWHLTGPTLDLQLTAFAAASFDAVRTRRYYDDLAGVYCDMAEQGIGRGGYGAEAAADIRLSYRWRVSLAASAGCYRYVRDPRVTILSDMDNTAVDMHARSRMGGCRIGGAPQFTGCAELGYFGPRGWGFRLSAGYVGGRFVEPMAVRRTDRIAGQAGITREQFEAFTVQERLADAVTLDAALFKSFRFGRSRLQTALSLRNLTGGQPVSDGYESLRVRRATAGDAVVWQPHASRYTYAYPRSFYLTATYRF